jgi:adenylate cyclase
VKGVLGADLKLDNFSNFVQEQRPGEHGIVWIFDTVGSLLAHPDFVQFVTDAMTHPSRAQLPSIDEISSGVAAAVLKSWPGGDPYDGAIRDDQGRDYLFRLAQFNLGKQYYVSVLLLAAQEDFVQDVRKLQVTGLILAIVAGCAFVPAVWLFGSGMSRSLKNITAQAVKRRR